jgi:hypothetical protein
MYECLWDGYTSSTLYLNKKGKVTKAVHKAGNYSGVRYECPHCEGELEGPPEWEEEEQGL